MTGLISGLVYHVLLLFLFLYVCSPRAHLVPPPRRLFMSLHPLPHWQYNSPLPRYGLKSHRHRGAVPGHCNFLSVHLIRISFLFHDWTVLRCCWWCRHRCPRHIDRAGDIMRNAMQCCYSFTRQRPLSCLFTFNVVHNSITPESSFHSFHSHLHRHTIHRIISARVALQLFFSRGEANDEEEEEDDAAAAVSPSDRHGMQ